MAKELEIINVFTPLLPTSDKIKPYLELIDASHHYSNNGPLVVELEQRLASFFNVSTNCVVTADNATNALIGSLSTSEAREGDWFLPSWTFVATPLAAFHAGVRYQFCDVDPDARAEFPLYCKNAIDVLPFGSEPRNYSKYEHLENLVIDGAASLQNLKDFVFPEFPTAIVISLHATKMFGAGEGGIVIFNSESWANNFRLWTKFGMDSSRIPTIAGLNCKMSEYTAAVALSSLDNFDQTKNLWGILNEKAREISRLNSLTFLEPLSYRTPSVYWNLEIPNISLVSSVIESLRARGIESRKWWPIATHTLDFFSAANPPKEGFSRSIYRAETTLGIPLHLQMDDSDFERVSSALTKVARLLEV